MAWRLTKEAERDLVEIARYTIAAFGPDQAMRYAALIEKGLDMLAENPLRATSRPRGELAPGETWVQESITGGRFLARYRIDDKGQVIASITGRAFVTAEATLFRHEDDPFRDGMPLQ